MAIKFQVDEVVPATDLEVPSALLEPLQDARGTGTFGERFERSEVTVRDFGHERRARFGRPDVVQWPESLCRELAVATSDGHSARSPGACAAPNAASQAQKRTRAAPHLLYPVGRDHLRHHVAAVELALLVVQFAWRQPDAAGHRHRERTGRCR